MVKMRAEQEGLKFDVEQADSREKVWKLQKQN